MSLFDVFKNKKERSRYSERSKTRLTEKKSAEAADAAETTAAPAIKGGGRAFGVLLAPHVTEKATYLSDALPRKGASGGHYVFEITKDANKQEVKLAVEGVYGVKVEKVRILAKRDKLRFMRGRYGRRPGTKKALVILKRGDKIEFV